MIFLTNEPIQHCPCCWRRENEMSVYARQDFYAGASCECPQCHTKYQYVPTEKLIEIAATCGDLDQYV